MTIAELLRTIGALVETGAPAARREALARETEALADMVGWAIGPIDPTGELLDRLAALQADLTARHAKSRDAAIALLHDALTDLGRAIARHDEDLDAGRDADEDEDVA